MFLDVRIEFDPVTYDVEEGESAKLRVVLIGESAIEVHAIVNTQDGTASSKKGEKEDGGI